MYIVVLFQNQCCRDSLFLLPNWYCWKYFLFFFIVTNIRSAAKVLCSTDVVETVIIGLVFVDQTFSASLLLVTIIQTKLPLILEKRTKREATTLNNGNTIYCVIIYVPEQRSLGKSIWENSRGWSFWKQSRKKLTNGILCLQSWQGLCLSYFWVRPKKLSARRDEKQGKVKTMVNSLLQGY